MENMRTTLAVVDHDQDKFVQLLSENTECIHFEAGWDETVGCLEMEAPAPIFPLYSLNSRVCILLYQHYQPSSTV